MLSRQGLKKGKFLLKRMAKDTTTCKREDTSDVNCTFHGYTYHHYYSHYFQVFRIECFDVLSTKYWTLYVSVGISDMLKL